MAKITVKDTEITVVRINDEDYICITDMIKAKDGDFFISDWLRNRNTVEFLGIWESVYNPAFNYGEFAIIKSQVGLNSYKISVKEWVEKTNALLIRQELPQSERLVQLNNVAITQMRSLVENQNLTKRLK